MKFVNKKYHHFSNPLYLNKFLVYENFESTFLESFFCVEHDAAIHLFQNLIFIVQKTGFHFFQKNALLTEKQKNNVFHSNY